MALALFKAGRRILPGTRTSSENFPDSTWSSTRDNCDVLSSKPLASTSMTSLAAGSEAMFECREGCPVGTDSEGVAGLDTTTSSSLSTKAPVKLRTLQMIAQYQCRLNKLAMSPVSDALILSLLIDGNDQVVVAEDVNLLGPTLHCVKVDASLAASSESRVEEGVEIIHLIR